jgi:sugar O-acyltransferase (sialic acid O-acetyltransferase NeuD family)
MKKLLIVGAGGYGREVLSYIEDDNPLFEFKGFLDDRSDIANKSPRNIVVISSPLTYSPLTDEVFMVAIGNPQDREYYTKNLRLVHNANFVTVVHPQANVSRHSHIGFGCVIGPRCGISVDTFIGNFTCIQEYTVIGHDSVIGNWCQINSHCTISGGSRIGDYVTIHPNSVVTSKAVIGDGVIVAPGSVVVGKISPGITVIGNPARKFEFKK